MPLLMGIVWAGVYDSNDAHVVACLVVGFVKRLASFLEHLLIWDRNIDNSRSLRWRKMMLKLGPLSIR